MTDESRRVALITGGSRGIGYAAASRLAEAGFDLVLAATSESNLSQAADQIHAEVSEVTILPLITQVQSEADVKALFVKVQKQFKKLDVLVNAAGMMDERPFSMTTSSALHEIFSVNMFGSYYCCQYASRLMARQKQGSIINLASAVGEQGASGQTAYAASKSAVSGFTRALAREVAPMNIRVNAVAPGFIDTDMTSGYVDERRSEVIKKTALQRAGVASEIAELIYFLASDAASYITGQVICIDGGLQL